MLEAKIERGKITLTPKLHAAEEYTIAQRKTIDAQLADALAEVKAGKAVGPFEIGEAITFLKNELKPQKNKNSKRQK